MRIALLTGEYPPQPGGVGDYCRCLAAALVAQGHMVCVLTIQDGQFILYAVTGENETQLAGDERIVITLKAGTLWWPMVRLSWGLRSWPYVLAAIEEWQPDWLHIQYQTGAYAMRAGVNFLPWRLRSLSRRPHVAVTFHDLLVPYLFPKAGLLRAWVNRQLAASADLVIATNQVDADKLRQFAQPALVPIGSNISPAPPSGYSRSAWRTQLRVGRDEFLVAYFGLLSHSKGVDLLVEALAGLDTTPWRLLLIGGAATAPQDIAYATALRARIEQLGLGARVISTGHVAAQEVSAHLLAADCVALPFRDGASFRRGSLLAALAHGCAVISTTPTDAETARDLAKGMAGLMVPPDDLRALRAALARLAADSALRASLAAAAPTVAAPFSWEAIAAQHVRLYASIN